MRDWDSHLKSLLDGELDADLEFTIKEMVGNAPVTLDDLKYACAIVRGTALDALRQQVTYTSTATDCRSLDHRAPRRVQAEVVANDQGLLSLRRRLMKTLRYVWEDSPEVV
jgi:hypothetical protein